MQRQRQATLKCWSGRGGMAHRFVSRWGGKSCYISPSCKPTCACWPATTKATFSKPSRDRYKLLLLSCNRLASRQEAEDREREQKEEATARRGTGVLAKETPREKRGEGGKGARKGRTNAEPRHRPPRQGASLISLAKRFLQSREATRGPSRTSR